MFDTDFDDGRICLVEDVKHQIVETEEAKKLRKRKERLCRKLIKEVKHSECFANDIVTISRFSDKTLCRIEVENDIAHVYRAIPLIFKSSENVYDLLEPLNDEWKYIGSFEI